MSRNHGSPGGCRTGICVTFPKSTNNPPVAVKNNLSFAILFGMMTLVPAREASGQVYAQQVWNQLQAAYNTVSDGNYEMWHYVMGSLGDDGEDSWTFTFEGGTQYKIIAACDNDCGDIDLHVMDDDGDEVTSDVSTDDVPIVDFTPGKGGGRYTIKVTMYECSSEPCYWGFGIYKR